MLGRLFDSVSRKKKRFCKKCWVTEMVHKRRYPLTWENYLPYPNSNGILKGNVYNKTMCFNRRLVTVSLTNINKNRRRSCLALRLIIVRILIFIRTVIIIDSTRVSVSCEPSFKWFNNTIKRKR